LGFQLGSRSRPFSPIMIQVAEIVVAIVEFVVGFLLLAFYALDVSGAGEQSAAITTIFPTVLLPIAFLSFTFGIFSLVIAMLALTNQPSERRVYSEQSYVSPEIAQTSVAVGRADQQTTPTQYAAAPQVVAELSRTVLQRTSSWSERVCAQCGREVQENAKFCDSCGSRLQPGQQAEHETPIEHPRTS
jgi:hypothetical protein